MTGKRSSRAQTCDVITTLIESSSSCAKCRLARPGCFAAMFMRGDLLQCDGCIGGDMLIDMVGGKVPGQLEYSSPELQDSESVKASSEPLTTDANIAWRSRVLKGLRVLNHDDGKD
jgi:hypothetical protein